jgi:hypothetical protein
MGMMGGGASGQMGMMDTKSMCEMHDKMMSAKAKVQPRAAKPAAPAVRPGVATSRSGIEASRRKEVTDRLAREGSVEAGAAFFKTLKF